MRATRSIAEAVRRHDCRIMSQLTHMDRRSQSDVESWQVLLAPSQIPEKVHREVPDDLEPEQIAVPSAPGVAGVRVWYLMSRGLGPRTGPPPPEGVHVTILILQTLSRIISFWFTSMHKRSARK